MKFQVNVNGRTYNVTTSGERKLSYFVEYQGEEIEILMGEGNEWISKKKRMGKDLIPVTELGEAIVNRFH